MTGFDPRISGVGGNPSTTKSQPMPNFGLFLTQITLTCSIPPFSSDHSTPPITSCVNAPLFLTDFFVTLVIEPRVDVHLTPRLCYSDPSTDAYPFFLYSISIKNLQSISCCPFGLSFKYQHKIDINFTFKSYCICSGRRDKQSQVLLSRLLLNRFCLSHKYCSNTQVGKWKKEFFHIECQKC